MKLFSTLVIISCLLFSACEKEEGFPAGYDHPCDYMLGKFEFLPTSLEKLVYTNHTQAIFVDTFGHETTFIISNSYDENRKDAIDHFWPDMTRTYYCYDSPSQKSILENDSLGILLGITLKAIVHSVDPLQKLIADEISISKVEEADSLIYFRYFKKIIDQRSFPIGDYNTNINPYTCFGRNFTEVENNTTGFGLPDIFYNDTEGILSFRDSSGKKWCFDRFE